MKKILDRKIVLIGLTLLAGVFIGLLISGGSSQKEREGLNHPTDSMHQHDETEKELWTCSMHPQIRQGEPGDCPICGMDLIPVVAASKANQSPLVTALSPEAAALVNIHTSRVSGVSSEGKIFLTGSIQPDEQRQASITAKFPGRIEQLYVDFTGELIRKGSRLASIYSPELVTAQQELLEAVSTKATFPELYEASRRKLQNWKLSESQIDQLEATGKVKDQFEILADKSGIVTQKNVTVGDYVGTGSVLFNVVDMRSLWVMLDAYESDLPFLKVGDAVEFTVAGVPGKTFQAKISFINPVIDAETRAANVRAEVLNESGILKPEMFVNAEIKVETPAGQTSLAIPRTALLWSGKRSVVYVKTPDATAPSYEMREVTIGSRIGEMWLIEGGLEAGEEIVTNGVFAIDAAAQLAGNYSMLNRPEIKTLEVPDAFRRQITALADAYFEMKKGLVESDPEATKAAATNLENALETVNDQTLKSEALQNWQVLKMQIGQRNSQVGNSSGLEEMREGFQKLSQSILEMTELYGLEKNKLYKNYCPMALNDQGAYWLSEVEDIRNPYFGDAMLRCGEVKEVYLRGRPVLEDDRTVSQPEAEVHRH